MSNNLQQPKQYTANFYWSAKDLSTKEQKLTLDSVEVNGVDWENAGAYPARWVAQDYHGEIYKSAHATNIHNIIQLKREAFICMDVGKWLDGEQTFGLYCSHCGWAVLCKYDPKFKQASQKFESERNDKCSLYPMSQLLVDFLNNMEGIQVISMVCTYQLNSPIAGGSCPEHLYVILPDMHIPQAVDPDRFPWKRDRSVRWWLHHRDPKIYPEASILLMNTEITQGNKDRDLFNAQKSLCALTRFLTQLAEFKDNKNISLVQVGDMYELWYKRLLRFSEGVDSEGRVILDGNTLQTARIVGEWIAGIHFIHQEVFAAFDYCQQSGIECVYIHGNHDSYLSNSEVVNAANTLLQEVSDFTHDYVPSKVYNRIPCFTDNGLRVEHGHNHYDYYNHDGSTGGYDKTNSANWAPQVALKFFDSYRRESFLTGGAALYMGSKCSDEGIPPFNLYVIGHTHKPDLGVVSIKNLAVNYVTEIVSHPKGDYSKTVRTVVGSLD